MTIGPTWRRRLRHGLFIVVGWGLFAWSWLRVTAADPEIGELRELLIGALVVVPLLTLSWVVHNVGIHRRRGARRAVPQVAWSYVVDFNGRRLDADWPTLQQARRIDIAVDGDRKHVVEAAELELVDAP
jgi:hypothetical protein